MGRSKRVECTVKKVVLKNERGIDIESVVVKCGECERTAQSYGTSARAVRRALSVLRENCPEGAEHYYVASDGEDED